MASGTISLGTKGYLTAQIKWESTAHDSTKNNSTVTAYLQIKRTNPYTTTGTWGGKLTVGSTSASITYHAAVTNSWVTIKTVTATVAHAANGSGTAYIYGKVTGPSGTSMSGTSISGSKTVTLDTIARAAAITSAPNFTDEDNPAIGYSNYAGSSVDSLQACIWVKDTDTYLAEYRDISKSGTSYTFSLTDAERETMRKACANAKSMNVRFYVTTVIDGTKFHKHLEKTLTITNAEPTLEPTVEDTNEATLALTGDSSVFVKGYSNASVSAGSVALKGASITSNKITNGSQSLSAASGTINAVDSGSFVFSATDSRGYTTSQTLNKTLVGYIKPTCSLKANKPTADGDMTFSISGNYFNGTFGAVANTITVQYCYAENDGDYGSWIDATPVLSGNTYKADVALTGLNYQSKYTFKARVIDALNTVDSAAKSVKSMPVFDWGENDFNFNAPVTMQDVLELLKHIYLPNNGHIYGTDTNGNKKLVFTAQSGANNTSIGYDNSVKGEGNTNIYGNNINLYSNGYINANVPIQTHAMSRGCSSELTLSTAYQKVTMGSSYGYTTDLLTASDGGIKCAIAGQVLVSAQAYFLNIGTSQAIAACIYLNGSGTAPVWGVSAVSGSDITLHLSPKIFNVSAGDVIYLYARNYSSATGTIPANNNTILYVQYLNA